MAKRITKLKIDEVSVCDRAANPGARVLIRKRSAEPGGMAMSLNETTSAIQKAADALRMASPGLTAAQAFTRIFEAMPPEVREEVKKGQRAAVDGVPRAHAEQSRDDDDASDDEDNQTRNRKKPKALRKLLKIAKRIRAESPSLTEAQSIAKALETPRGAELYRQDRVSRLGV